MRANYDALTSAENSARFHVYCLDRQSALILRRDNSAFAITELPYGRGSWGHAQTIERAIQSIVAGEINIFHQHEGVLIRNNIYFLRADGLCGPLDRLHMPARPAT